MYFRKYQFRIAVYEIVSVSIRAAFVDSRVRQGSFLCISDEVGKLKKVVICFVRFDVVPELGLTQQLCSCSIFFKGCVSES